MRLRHASLLFTIALLVIVLHLGRGALSLEWRVAVENDVGVHAVLVKAGLGDSIKLLIP